MLTLDMTTASTPTLTITDCPSPPQGEKVFYLRGTMNNWSALETYAFEYRCDAYYLNVKLNGLHEFRLADSENTQATVLAISGQTTRLVETTKQILTRASQSAVGNMAFDFQGEYTIRLDLTGASPMITIGPKSIADPPTVTFDDPIAATLLHDTRSPADKLPFGAVTPGTEVGLSLRASSETTDVTVVIESRHIDGNQERIDYREIRRIAMSKNHGTDTNRWSAKFHLDEIGSYGYYFEATVAGAKYVIQNNAQSVFWTREKGTNGLGAASKFPTQRDSIRRFRHTVFAKTFVVPDWAHDAIYYYIFPDRFRNGDKLNDPKPGITRYQDKSVELHKNWTDKPYKPKSGDGSDEVYNNDFFGGDLAGIIEKLDYIQSIGANVIYMTPIFTAASNHKYDTADYRNIDPHFGTNAQFEALTRAAKSRGIRVIADASLNHTGSDSIYFDRFDKYALQGAFAGGKLNLNSPYNDWYQFEPTPLGGTKRYKGWLDLEDLPELNKSSRSFRQHAYGAADSTMKLWLDRGASGWRMDVAPWVPDDFWREWRTAVKQHSPNAITIAETWFEASKHLVGDMFDSTMNYVFRDVALAYAGGGDARALYPQLELLREVYPPQALHALMNLISSHDVARALHVLHSNTKSSNRDIDAEAKRRLQLAVFFQMTYPGAPAIYYGDEVGVTGGEDPYNRATYPWLDLGGNPDLKLLETFTQLAKLRGAHPVLRRGTLEAPIYLDQQVSILVRRLEKMVAIVAMNNSTTPRVISVSLPNDIMDQSFSVLLDGKKISSQNRRLEIEIPPLFGSVLLGSLTDK
ncbi:MAG: hypothetical protein ING75_08550 [Rhodocyclaceae bacterium]|nr:hypothetical protein [Rhodocyclaceae bacterium]